MSSHLYQRWGGRLSPPRESDTSRFWRYVDLEDVLADGCWMWRGSRSPQGYGLHSSNKRVGRAHRFAYELMVGPISDGLTLDHTCHDRSECDGGTGCPHRACVNPAHLEPVTLAANVRRASAGVTHCPKGHPYDEANTYRPPGRPSSRRCRICGREKMRELYWHGKVGAA